MFFSLMKHSYQVLIALSRERCYPYRKLIPGSFGGEGGVEIKKKKKRERGEKNEHMGCKISELLKTSGGKTVAKHNTWIWGQGAGSGFQSLGGVFQPEAPSVHGVSLKGTSAIGASPFDFSGIHFVGRSCVA